MTNTFFQGSEKFCRGDSPLCATWLQACACGQRLRSAHALISHRDKIKTIVSDEVNYRGTQS